MVRLRDCFAAVLLAVLSYVGLLMLDMFPRSSAENAQHAKQELMLEQILSQNRLLQESLSERGALRSGQSLPGRSGANPTIAPDSVEVELMKPSRSGANLTIAPDSVEAELMKRIPIANRKRYLPASFPVPAIAVWLDTAEGCLIGERSCGKLKPFPNKSVWTHDPHIIGFVKSTLVDCMFREQPCFAIDIGANFGVMTLTMLQMHTHVVSVEPQLDLCASLMASVQRGGLADRSEIRCGALASSELLNLGTTWLPNFPTTQYRYGGKVVAPFSYSRYGLKKGVPVIRLGDLLPPPGTPVQLLKIDTDSIDCDLLWRQLLPRLQRNETEVRNICLESSGCTDMSAVLHEYQKLGYTIYRTLLWQYKFDAQGGPAVALDHKKPEFADEVFDLRFMRHLWRFRNMSLKAWHAAVAGHPWQYLLTTEVFESIPYEITEKT